MPCSRTWQLGVILGFELSSLMLTTDLPLQLNVSNLTQNVFSRFDINLVLFRAFARHSQASQKAPLHSSDKFMVQNSVVPSKLMSKPVFAIDNYCCVQPHFTTINFRSLFLPTIPSISTIPNMGTEFPRSTMES